jgi:hypothetical protein
MKQIAPPIVVLLLLGCSLVSGPPVATAAGSRVDKRHALEKKAVPSKSHPLAGFWKSGGCSDRFGLAITPAGKQLYSISFCGPGGCFDPGTYRPNSKIVGDPAYRVINKNTIDVKGLDGFTRYVRCKAR